MPLRRPPPTRIRASSEPTSYATRRLSATRALACQHIRPTAMTSCIRKEDRQLSKALPHDALGDVDRNAYKALLRAVSSGRSADFEEIPLGGPVKLRNPQGAFAFRADWARPAPAGDASGARLRQRGSGRGDGGTVLAGADPRRAVLRSTTRMRSPTPRQPICRSSPTSVARRSAPRLSWTSWAASRTEG